MYKLLIADDEVIEREAFKFIIKKNFSDVIEVLEAGNGKEAIEKSMLYKPEIIFFDIKMPGINGLEAATKIREFLPDCRMTVISAYHYFNYAKDALVIGADDYITKPAPEEIIISAIKRSISLISIQVERKKKEEDLDFKLKQVTYYLENELLNLLATGEIENKAANNYFEMLGVKCSSYLCFVLSVSNLGFQPSISEDMQKSIIKKRMIEKIKVKLSESGYSFFIGPIGQEIYLLLTLDKELLEYESRIFALELVTDIKEKIYKDIQVNLSAGIGSICYSASNIYNSFVQAKIALKYDMHAGSINSFGDISKGNIISEYPLNKEKLLVENLLLGNKDCAGVYIDDIFDWMAMNINEISFLKQRILELIMVIVRGTIINTSMSEINSDIEDVRKTLFSLDTPKEIKKFTRNYLLEKSQEIQVIKEKRANSLLVKAMNYIDKNFINDVSLEDISKIFHISPFYLSKLFKQDTGQNFVDYITNIRIQKAKELMTDPVNNIKDICYLVGYKDPNYFARVFKKNCGVTPTEYKTSIV